MFDTEQDITKAEEKSVGIAKVISECEHHLEIRKEWGDKAKHITQKIHEEIAASGIQSPIHTSKKVGLTTPTTEHVSNIDTEQPSKKLRPKLPRLFFTKI